MPNHSQQNPDVYVRIVAFFVRIMKYLNVCVLNWKILSMKICNFVPF